jgi:acyl phosphate:glycerol-3-phosphate acyltransferase
MINPVTALLVVVIGYLAGSISFTWLITRLVSPNTSLQEVGVEDEKTGIFYRRRVANATTASMALGWKVGCAISLMDMLKVALPVFVLRQLFPGEPYFLIAALAGVIGNNWPIFHGFSGGTGLSAILGGLIVIDPLSIPVSVFAGSFVGLVVLRSMGITFPLSMFFIIPWLWFRTNDVSYLIYSIGVNICFILTLIPDIILILKTSKGKIPDERTLMGDMPMGRGMMRMMDWLWPKKEKSETVLASEHGEINEAVEQ